MWSILDVLSAQDCSDDEEAIGSWKWGRCSGTTNQMGRLTTLSRVMNRLFNGLGIGVLICALMLSGGIATASSKYWSEEAEKDLAIFGRPTLIKFRASILGIASGCESRAKLPHQKLVDRLVEAPQVAPAILDIYGLDSYPYNPQLPGTVQSSSLRTVSSRPSGFLDTGQLLRMCGLSRTRIPRLTRPERRRYRV